MIRRNLFEQANLSPKASARRQFMIGSGLMLSGWRVSAAQSNYSSGALFLNAEQYRSLPKFDPAAMTGETDRADLSRFLPPAGNQGAQGSCVGWAIGYGLAFSLQKKVDSSFGQLLSPSFLYNQVKAGSCDDGAYIKDALVFLKNYGTPTIDSFSYDSTICDRSPSRVQNIQAAGFRSGAWRSGDPKKLDEIKNLLRANYIVAVGIDVYIEFHRLRSDEVMRQVSGRALGGHALLVSGFDDRLQAFRLFNSWGQKWGESGYGWVGYSTFSRILRETYAVEDISTDAMLDRGEFISADDLPLTTNQYLRSRNKQYFAIMQVDGNFVIYSGPSIGSRNTKPIFDTKTVHPHGQYFLNVQNDGNLVVYRGSGRIDNNGVVWESKTNGTSRSNVFLIMQDDGNLVLYRGNGPTGSGAAIWSSKHGRA